MHTALYYSRAMSSHPVHTVQILGNIMPQAVESRVYPVPMHVETSNVVSGISLEAPDPSSATALVIDNGSWEFRAGFAHQTSPSRM